MALMEGANRCPSSGSTRADLIQRPPQLQVRPVRCGGLARAAAPVAMAQRPPQGTDDDDDDGGGDGSSANNNNTLNLRQFAAATTSQIQIAKSALGADERPPARPIKTYSWI